MIVQSNIKKNIPEKSNDKTFEKTKIFHWAMVPIVKKNQNAAKNQTLSLSFLKHPLIWYKITKNTK